MSCSSMAGGRRTGHLGVQISKCENYPNSQKMVITTSLHHRESSRARYPSVPHPPLEAEYIFYVRPGREKLYMSLIDLTESRRQWWKLCWRSKTAYPKGRRTRHLLHPWMCRLLPHWKHLSEFSGSFWAWEEPKVNFEQLYS